MFYVYKSYKGQSTLYNTAETKAEAVKIEAELRKELLAIDPDGTVMGCYIRSEEELEAEKAAAARWDALTDEEKKETVIIDGKKYVKAMLRERIKSARKVSGLTQVEFCKKYEIPKRTLEDWERGARVPAPWAVKLIERVVKEDTEGASE